MGDVSKPKGHTRFRSKAKGYVDCAVEECIVLEDTGNVRKCWED
jgi:hypothetical protein